MSGLGALWGFVKSKLGSAAFRNVGTSAGDVVQLNGSAQLPAVDGSLLTGVGGGGASWTLVATLAELNTALVDGARVLVTETIAMTGSETAALPTSGQVTIGRASGVQITHASTPALFTLASGACRLRLVDSNDSDDVPFLSPNGGGSPFVATSGALTVEWDRLVIGQTGSMIIGGSGVTLLGGQTTIIGADAQVSILFAGYLGSVTHIGGGSSAAIVVGGHIGHLKCDGTYRSYTTDNSSTTYAVLIGNASYDCSRVDGIDGDGLSSGTLIYVSALAGVGRIDTGGKLAVQARATVENAGSIAQLVVVSAFLSGTIRRALFGSAILFETGGGNLVLEDCYYAGANTIPSGSALIIRGGTLQSGASMTFESGSKSSLYDFVNDSGTITIDSGAAIRSERLSSTGGTITNNDPLSILTGSEDVSLDTTPATRRFNNATLDGEALQSLMAYWPGNAWGLNLAPSNPGAVGGSISGLGSAAISGGEIDVPNNTSGWSANLPWHVSRGQFTISLDITPVLAVPATNLVIFRLDAATTITVTINTSGALLGYVGSLVFTTATGIFSDGIKSKVTFLRRYESGTLTANLIVDGVIVGTAASTSECLSAMRLLNAQSGSSLSYPGKYSEIYCFSLGISDAAEALLGANPLQGAGI